MNKTYTVKQVAQALGFSTNTVYKYLEEGRIKATRLGTEGRFRIPEAEVIRLLQLKGENPQIAPAFNSEQPESEDNRFVSESGNQIERGASDFAERQDYNLKLGLLHKVSDPDLFDWFLALTAIFLGIVYFLFPLSYQYVSFEPYRWWNIILNISLVVSGVALMAEDVFVPAKKLYHHLVIRLPLVFIFAVLTLILYKTSNYLLASYFVTLAVFSILPAFWPKGSIIKFVAFVYCLVVISGWIWAHNPQPFIFADIRDFVYASPGLFQTLIVAGSTVLAGIMIFTYFNSQPLFLLLSWLMSGLFFLLSISFINNQAWNMAVVSLMIASFSLILPFYKKLDTLSKFSRKDVLVSFSWMVLILLIGISVVFYTQTTFKTFVLKESQKKVETAAKLISGYMEDSIKYTNTIAQNPTLADILSAKKIDREKLEGFVRAEFNGATTLKRVAIFNEKGDLLAAYPPGISQVIVNISDTDHFQQAKELKKTVISKLIESRIAKGTYTIVVAAPIFGATGDFLGMVGGGVDTAQLQSKLSILESGNRGSIVLADTKKVIFIHENKELIGKPADFNRALLQAVEGHSAAAEGYSENGELNLQAYTQIPLTGWGVVSQQPVSEVFRDSSMISFAIFLITILSGVGTLLTTMYLKKRQL